MFINLTRFEIELTNVNYHTRNVLLLTRELLRNLKKYRTQRDDRALSYSSCKCLTQHWVGNIACDYTWNLENAHLLCRLERFILRWYVCALNLKLIRITLLLLNSAIKNRVFRYDQIIIITTLGASKGVHNAPTRHQCSTYTILRVMRTIAWDKLAKVLQNYSRTS